MIRPDSSIPDDSDALSLVRGHLSKHRGGREWDAHDLALVLRLPEVEVQGVLEALRDDEGGQML